MASADEYVTVDGEGVVYTGRSTKPATTLPCDCVQVNGKKISVLVEKGLEFLPGCETVCPHGNFFCVCHPGERGITTHDPNWDIQMRIWINVDAPEKNIEQREDWLISENNRLQQWVNDLQSGMYVNCVYCGHRYGPEQDTPATMSDILKEHIEHCSNHPMSSLRAECERLKKAIRDAIEWSNGHWDEWGDRAKHCLYILEKALNETNS